MSYARRICNVKYLYPATFEPVKEDNAIYVRFPDFENCFTDGETPAEAAEYAEDALNMWMLHLERNGDHIPAPTNIQDIEIPKGGYVMMIPADTVAYARATDNKAVRKNVSIPSWLNTLATEKNINFSNVLQNALMRELGIRPA